MTNIRAISATTDTIILKLYPNPTDGLINVMVSSETEKTFSIIVYNLIGKEIHRETNLDANEEKEINLCGFPNGVYNCMIICKKEVRRVKIIIN